MQSHDRKDPRNKAFMMENPRDFALEVMLNNDFKSVQELSAYLKKLPYCVAPWLHSHLNPAGERKLCCVARPSGIDYAMPFDEYWNSEYLQKVREKMLQQDPPEECTKCIYHNGTGPQRTMYLHLLLHLPKLSEMEWKPVTDRKPVSIDYRINRSCNFTCRMCTSTASSAIEKLEQEASASFSSNLITKEMFLSLKNEIFEVIHSGQVVDINFADGEPFISPLHWEMLDFLVANNLSKKVILRYSSNISTLNYKGIFIPQYLKENFSKVFVSMSIDGVEKTAEFVRDGLRWDEWFRNYQLLKEHLGEKSIRFNITVTIPVLLDIVNMSSFLDKEKIDFSISSSYAEGNELLLSPLALDRETLKDIVTTRLIHVENKDIRQYLENLLEHKDLVPLDNLKENFVAIRTYYIKIDSTKKRSSTIEYFSNQVELRKWWDLICPKNLQATKPKEISAIAKISEYVPNELGRLAYIASFMMLKSYIKLKYGNRVTLWYRNSLRQNFFKFGKSDIDVSVEFKNNKDVGKINNEINEILLSFPLIKEVNVYYPYTLSEISLLNQFELMRDKILLSKLPRSSVSTTVEAQRFTFLLRMLFANKAICANGIHGRDLIKWKNYLAHCGCEEISESLEGNVSFSELLELILKNFSLDIKKYSKSIEQVLFYIANKIEIHVLYSDLKFKNEMLSLFPYLFCSLDVSLVDVSNFNEDVFIEQISWEMMSVMSQLKGDGQDYLSIEHLKNLERCLKNANLENSKNIETREKLLLTFKSALDFLEGVLNEQRT